MGSPKKEQTGDFDIQELNKGVDFMEKNNNDVVTPVTPVTPVAPVANNTQTNSQPLVNTEAVKAKTNELMGKAKNGVAYYKANIKTDKKLWIGTAVAAVVVIFLFMALFGGGAKGVAKKYAKALVNYDADAMLSIYHKDWIEEVYDDEEEALDSFKEMMEYLEDSDLEYISFKVDPDYKEYDEDDVEEYAEYLDEYRGIDEDSVKAVRRYTIKFEVENDGDEDTQKVKILVAKIGNKWYYAGSE